jgi:hypothetical protein
MTVKAHPQYPGARSFPLAITSLSSVDLVSIDVVRCTLLDATDGGAAVSLIPGPVISLDWISGLSFDPAFLDLVTATFTL